MIMPKEEKMSGGSYNYIYSKLSVECEGEMHDEEMNAMIKDLCDVLHDLEWWQSGDYSEDQYRETVSEFKKKWFKGENRSTVYTQENTPGLRDKFADGIATVFFSFNAFLDFIDGKYSPRYDVFLDYDDETYIINRETGKYVNWYKGSHIGRDIHTNVEPDKIVEFLREFKEDEDDRLH